jgi:hypothetical protein
MVPVEAVVQEKVVPVEETVPENVIPDEVVRRDDCDACKAWTSKKVVPLVVRLTMGIENGISRCKIVGDRKIVFDGYIQKGTMIFWYC